MENKIETDRREREREKSIFTVIKFKWKLQKKNIKKLS